MSTARKAQAKKLTVYCEQCGHGTESILGTDAIASLRELVEAAKKAEELINSAIIPLLGCDPAWDEDLESTVRALRSALEKAEGKSE